MAEPARKRGRPPKARAITNAEWKESLRKPEDISPRGQMGLRLLVHGGMTVKDAAATIGMHPGSLGIIKNSPAGKAYMDSAHKVLENKALQGSALISALSRRAIEIIAETMEDAENPALRLKAAQDIADRAPETAKTQKHHVESFTLSGKDAQAIALAMTESAKAMQSKEYQEIAAGGDFIKTDLAIGSDASDSTDDDVSSHVQEKVKLLLDPVAHPSEDDDWKSGNP